MKTNISLSEVDVTRQAALAAGFDQAQDGSAFGSRLPTDQNDDSSVGSACCETKEIITVAGDENQAFRCCESEDSVIRGFSYKHFTQPEHAMSSVCQHIGKSAQCVTASRE
ncbi:MAG TPA: hypothetical protein VK530_01805 [Candidatus Acidoferrum sp.]|nr:hypothetical protein [Candidatus Acidoferrum sp.]